MRTFFLSVMFFYPKEILRACELDWLPWSCGYRPLWESSCSDQLVSFNFLLSLVVGRDHQVIIWIHVLKGRRFALDGGRFAVHAGDLQHPAGVMLQQIPCKSFPSSSHTDHDMLVVQHLERKESRRVKFWEPSQAPWSTCSPGILSVFCFIFRAPFSFHLLQCLS